MTKMLSFARMSLVMRVSLVVACLLTIAGAISGFTIFKTVHSSLINDLEAQIDSRLEWMEASIELDGRILEFEPNQARLESKVAWQVSLRNGRVLWSENWSGHEHKTTTRTKTISLGDPKGNLVLSDSLVSLQVPGPYGHSFQLPDLHGRIDLIVAARASNAPVGGELRRLTLALWTIEPLSIAVLSTILALFIRWQLRPLGEISLRAAEIDPQNVDKRIEAVGNSIECVRLRDSINTMIDRLAHGLARERQFAFAAAHELRTPIAQLRTSIEVALRKDRESVDYRRTLTESLEDVVRMQNLVESLLLFARTQQQSGLAADAVELSRIVTHAAQRAGVAVEYVAPIGPFQVKGNEELLICGCRNVLENAARYAAGSAPQIRASVQDGNVVLVIADDGPGIQEGDRERIFEPLTRLDAARSISAATDGFGLGLAVARSAIRICGGHLFCRARQDGHKGSEFVFRLSLAAAN